VFGTVPGIDVYGSGEEGREGNGDFRVDFFLLGLQDDKIKYLSKFASERRLGSSQFAILIDVRNVR